MAEWGDTANPLTTDRLVVRVMRPHDIPTFAAYRNDPDVARHQLWDLPYTDDDAHGDLDDQADRSDVVAGRWTQLAIEHDGEVIGDVALHLDATGKVAEIGFTLAREHWGHGYATEAAGAVLADLVDRVGVIRVIGELDPPNTASARVLERIGLRHEVTTKKSFFWRGEWTDNTTYSTTAEDWCEWRRLQATPVDEVELVEITSENQEAYAGLAAHEGQRRLVAPMLGNYGDALFPPEEQGVPLVPVLRGIAADTEPAGFLMYAAANETVPEPYLWRLLVAAKHQGRGIGRMALDLLATALASEGHRVLMVSFVDDRGGPKEFYLRSGFELTGTMNGDEVEARRRLK